MKETGIRDKAVESIRSVSESLPGSDVEKHLVPMINRLEESVNYHVITQLLYISKYCIYLYYVHLAHIHT